jgi:hypothetical protein
MTFSEFQDSLQHNQPPAGISEPLRALWYAGKKDWKSSHDIAQDIPSTEGSWIHAYLHRWEGDEWNANYWYRRAGRSMPTVGLEEEWEHITQHLLDA